MTKPQVQTALMSLIETLDLDTEIKAIKAEHNHLMAQFKSYPGSLRYDLESDIMDMIQELKGKLPPFQYSYVPNDNKSSSGHILEIIFN